MLPWGSTKSVSINIIFIFSITMCRGTEVVSKRGKIEESREKRSTKKVGGVGGGPAKMFDKHQIVCEVFSRLSKDSIFCCQTG